MSDFIFSRNKTNNNSITRKLKTVYKENVNEIKEYHGEWGSIGVIKNIYNGFNSHENDEAVIIVIGGPVLKFRDNNFIKDYDSSEGTQAIFQRWKNGDMKWDTDLSGPFSVLIVNKKTSQFICVTDLMSFIPVYVYDDSSNIVLSTHIDVLADFTEQTNDLDETSIIDFILHGIITYPFTMYKKIFQISPASVSSEKDNKLNNQKYWLPIEKNVFSSINQAANDIKISLKEYVNNITNQTTNIAQFISGGEDSRVLAGLLKNNYRDAFVFLDQMNREGQIASKISDVYGANFKPFIRDELHYLNILPGSADLVGSSSQYQHAHTYGFHTKTGLINYDAVFGGLFSDALLKGIRINKYKISGRLPFIPETKKKKDINLEIHNDLFFNQERIYELKKRRKSHFKYIQSIRIDSASEWFEIWPSSMNLSIPNFHVNRRLFRSYEPFLSNEIVKIAASVPQKWKMNRKLFHKMAKPLLEPSKNIRHGDGWYPYYSWILKSITYPLFYFSGKMKKKIGISKGNQGPWSEWDKLIKSEEWTQMFESYKISGVKFENIFKKDINVIFKNGELSTSQKINLLQLLYRNM